MGFLLKRNPKNTMEIQNDRSELLLFGNNSDFLNSSCYNTK